MKTQFKESPASLIYIWVFGEAILRRGEFIENMDKKIEHKEVF